MSKVSFSQFINTHRELTALLSIVCLFAGFLSSITVYAAPSLSIGLVQLSTGTAPFDANDAPGRDSSANNNIVRTVDEITYRWDVSVSAQNATNVTITHTLPVGLVWIGNLPAFCTGTGSGFANNQQTIICNVGSINTGSTLSYISTQARVRGDNPNGTTLVTSAQVTADGATQASSNSVSATVSASLRADLIVSNAGPNIRAADGPNGEPGIIVPFEIGMKHVNKRGSEALGQPITFNTNLIYNTPAVNGSYEGARLYTWGSYPACGRSLFNNQVNPNPVTQTQGHPQDGVANGTIGTAEVTNSGDITCSQPGGVSTPVQVSVENADTSGTFYPTTGYGLSLIDSQDGWFSSHYALMWIPVSDVQVTGTESINYSFTATDFSPLSTAGTTNNTTGNELNTTNNTATKTINISNQGNFTTQNFGQDFPITTIRYLTPGHRMSWSVVAQNIGTYYTWNDLTSCAKIDTTKHTLDSVRINYGSTFRTSSNVDVSNAVFEYTDSPLSGNIANDTCFELDGPWVTDPSTLTGGLNSVTRVRLRNVDNMAPNTTLNMTVNTRILDNPNNTAITLYSTFQSPDIGANGLFYRQNSISLTKVLNNVYKTITNDPPNNTPTQGIAGKTIKYTLQYSPTNASHPGINRLTNTDVTITDTLPSGQSYVIGSSSVEPTSITSNPDGTTTLIWSLNSVEVKILNSVQVYPRNHPDAYYITYKTLVNAFLPNNTIHTSLVTISSPDDASQDIPIPPAPIAGYCDASFWQFHCNQATITILNTGAFNLQKLVDKTYIRPNETFTYTIDYANLTGSDINSTDIIDILPYNGDNRSPASLFQGQITLNSVNVNNGENILYTKQIPANINPDPCDASNIPNGSTISTCGSTTGNGNTLWCNSLSGGACPSSLAEVTALRVQGGLLPFQSGGNPIIRSFTVILNTTGNNFNDIYTNRIVGRAEGFSLPAMSTDVSTFVKGGSISGYVVKDLNLDSLFDNNDQKLTPITVTLLDGSSNVLASRQTDVNGKYEFGDLIDQVYNVQITPAIGSTPSFDPDGVSSANIASTTLTYDPVSGVSSVNNFNFGIKGDGSVGDTIFRDVNGNGIQDTGDNGIGGVEIELIWPGLDNILNSSDDESQIVLTDVNGNYSFSNLFLTDYKINVVAPAGTVQTADPDITLDSQHDFTLSQATPNNQDVDFGYATSTVVEGRVFHDYNGNGIYNGGEIGIDGVLVEIFRVSDDTLVAFNQSDTNGQYSLTNLAPGNYYLTFSNLPSGYVFSPNLQGSDPNLDSDPGLDGRTANFTLVDAQVMNNLDAGAFPQGTITGKVFYDPNNDGLQNQGENDASNINIILTETSGTQRIYTTTTQADGSYSINVIAGTYNIDVQEPPNYTVSNNTDPISNLDLAAGQTLDAGSDGLYLPAIISGKLFRDVNGNGLQDLDEPDGNIPLDTIVSITNTANQTQQYTPTINMDGSYSQALAEGEYIINVTPPNNYLITTSNPSVIQATSGSNVDGGLDGLYIPAIISGKVFVDSNNNGLQDLDEPDGNIPSGTSITITNSANSYTPSINTDGSYTQNVVPGSDYAVTINPTSTFTVTTENPTINLIAIGGQDTDAGGDGLYSPGSLSGQLFMDFNNNGTPEGNEIGATLPTQTSITITNGVDTYNPAIASDGSYEIINLAPGTYSITINAPANYQITGGSNPISNQVVEVNTNTFAPIRGLFLPSQFRDIILIPAGRLEYQPDKLTPKEYCQANITAIQRCQDLIGAVINDFRIENGASCQFTARSYPSATDPNPAYSTSFFSNNGQSTYQNGRCETILLKAQQNFLKYDIRIRITNPDTGPYALDVFGAEPSYHFTMGGIGAIRISGSAL